MVVYSIILTFLGLMAGSFAGATVWRLRARQLVEDKQSGEEVDKAEYKRLAPLTKETTASDRSRCLHCNHQLQWFDLVPLISWIGLRGKCRYCRHPIGRFEPVIEVGMALFFVISYLFWPLPLSMVTDIIIFILWLLAGVGLGILFAYDQKWFLLPDRVMLPLLGLASISAGIQIFTSTEPLEKALAVAGAVAILSGLYYIIYLLSRRQWVGFGDVKLGLVLALLLTDWQLAFIALFVANLIGTLLVLPSMVRGTLARTAHIPFGPFLIAGAVVAMLLGPTIIDYYVANLLIQAFIVV